MSTLALSSKFGSLANYDDCFSSIFSFVRPEDVALAERVCRTWNRAIKRKDQAIWKQQYLNFFHSKTVPANGQTYKQMMTPIYGDVYFLLPTILAAFTQQKEGDNGVSPTLINMAICLNEQLEAQSRPFRAEQAELSYDCGKELVAPFRSGESPSFTKEFFNLSKLNRFAGHVPLYSLINPSDGTYKKAADKIKLVWKEYRLILSCSNLNKGPFDNFGDRLTSDVEVSIQYLKLTQEELDKAKALAKTSSEWASLR